MPSMTFGHHDEIEVPGRIATGKIEFLSVRRKRAAEFMGWSRNNIRREDFGGCSRGRLAQAGTLDVALRQDGRGRPRSRRKRIAHVNAAGVTQSFDEMVVILRDPFFAFLYHWPLRILDRRNWSPISSREDGREFSSTPKDRLKCSPRPQIRRCCAALWLGLCASIQSGAGAPYSKAFGRDCNIRVHRCGGNMFIPWNATYK